MAIEDVLAKMSSTLEKTMPIKKVEELTDGISELFKEMKARRTPISDFMEYLEDNTNWLTAPTPDKNIDVGLLEYGISVAKEMLSIRGDVDEESCIVVGLFHEVGYVAVDSEEFEEREGEDPEVRAMRIAARSLRLLSEYVPLEPVEAQAILYHDVKEIPVERKKLTELLQQAIQNRFA
ncbi:MAG: hypothetical protein ACXQTD_00605 [Candidatus Syntropharchaeia archaeon]